MVEPHSSQSQALLVADAGFIGFDFWRTLDAHRHAFLIRLSSVCHFYADFQVDADFKEGIAWLWPNDQRHLPPLQVRIIRLAAKNPRHDVWLATNILDSARLSHADADKMFRARWEHEIFYRGYQRTLDQAKLSSRTAKQAIREVEIALMGTQLLLAQTQWALIRAKTPGKPSMASAVRQIGREMRGLLTGKTGTGYLQRLAQAVRENRPNRTTPKTTRDWPRKNNYKPPRPPNFHPLEKQLQSLRHNALRQQSSA